MNKPIAMPRSEPWRADATRYNMLYRLVPSMNHKMAGSMQPVAMLAGMLARHLKRENPDIQVLSQTVSDMQLACKASVAARTEVLGWLQASGEKKITLADGVMQCTNLLAAEIAISGSTIDNQTAQVSMLVDQSSVRSLLTAALFAVLDLAIGPVAIQLRAELTQSDATTLTISWSPLAEPGTAGPDTRSHRIDWDGVQAIADQVGVTIQHKSNVADMLFPAAV